MYDGIYLSLWCLPVNKHTDSNSQVSLLRVGESQEQLMLVLPMQLPWRDAWEGTWHLCSEKDQVSRLREWFQRLSVIAASSQCGVLTRLRLVNRWCPHWDFSLSWFIFLHVDFFHCYICAYIVPCCKPGGFLRFVNVFVCVCAYKYAHMHIYMRHLMENGTNFLNQQHIPKSAFCAC